MNKYIILAAVTQLVASTIPSASRIVLNGLAVEPYIALRWTISASVFGVLLLLRKEKCVWEFRLLAKVSLLGLSGYGLASLGTLYAVKIGFGLLTLLSPLVVVALSPLVLKERIRRNTWLALAIAGVGIGLTVQGKITLSSTFSALAAAALVIAAYTCDTLTFLYSKPFRRKLPLLQYLVVAQATAAILMWIVSFFLYPVDKLLPAQTEIWAAVFYVGLVSCVGIFFVWYWLLKHLHGQQLGILQYLHGLAAAIWGVALFGEAWSWSMVLGSVLLLSSILVASRT